MIVFSEAIVASRPLTFEAYLPVVCYENLVTISNIEADEEDAGYPATNLANPDTHSQWKSASTSEQYLTVTIDADGPLDYAAIARHNFGSGLCVVSVEALTAEPDAEWIEVVGETVLPDNSAAILVFEEGFYIGVRLRLQPGSVEPQAAVLSIGRSLKIQRGVQPGHIPIKYARARTVTSGKAQNGDYLGNIVLKQSLANGVDIKQLDPDWYRQFMQPFIDVANEPFFFAWSPLTYPDEVGYAWVTNDPQPQINEPTGEIDISLQLGAVTF